MTKRSFEHVGSSLDEWLAEEGLLDQASAKAIKSTIAWQLQAAMQERQLSKAALVRGMGTTKAQLDRLLDPLNTSLTLKTLARCADVLGKDLRIELVEPRSPQRLVRAARTRVARRKPSTIADRARGAHKAAKRARKETLSSSKAARQRKAR